MQHQEFDAPAELQDTIKCFWHTQIDFGKRPSTFEVVPDGYAEIIFHFGSPCSVSYNGNWEPLPSPFLMGLLNQPVLLTTQNRLDVLGVRCFPWTVFDLLGLPAGNDAVRVFEHPIAPLQATLDTHMQADRIPEAIALLQQYFVTARSQIAADSMLFKAGVAMQEASGTLPVRQVAVAAQTTVRTLERKFKQSSGHTVKDVSGLMRFEQVRNHLWRHPQSNLADLAQELGYTDQSHLSRDFKRYSGTTPAAFARKAKHGKQVISNDFVAFVQA